MKPTFDFVERCPVCGEDIYWHGRINQRPPCQNCQEQESNNKSPFVSEFDQDMPMRRSKSKQETA